MKDKLLELHKDWSEMPLKQDLDYIYHYTSPIGLDGIFVNHQLWANDIYRQNDKTEGVYILNMLKNNIDELCNVEKVRKVILKQIEELRPKLVDGFYNHEKYRTFIISFSTKPDELSLWNYYTKDKNSVGYNVQFNVNTLVTNLDTRKIKNEDGHIQQYLDKLDCKHGEVIYDERKQLDILKKVINRFIEITEVWNDEWAYLLVDKIIWIGTFFKSPYFRHEYEYRLVFSTYTDKSKLELDEVPIEIDGKLKNHIEIYFDSAAIGDVRCSPTNSRDNIKYPRKYMTRHYPNFKSVVESEVPFRII